MDEDAGRTSPKTLADVSHLFFSRTQESTQQRPVVAAGEDEAGGEVRTAVTAHETEVAPRKTRLFVVTGGDDAPGKSTVAVNLAAAFLPFGRVAVFDADPRIPNARYYLGLPSWHYLSPLTGDGAAPSIETGAGIIVADWSHEAVGPEDWADGGSVVWSDASGLRREPVDFAVVDVPASRTRLLSDLSSWTSMYVVTARPGRRGYEHAFVTLRTLKRVCHAASAALVISGAVSVGHAEALHRKVAVAAERLLSMDVRLMGAVLPEPGLGVQQRERGVIVSSRPDSATALSLRQLASAALQLTRADGRVSD